MCGYWAVSDVLTMRWWSYSSANVARLWRHYFAPIWSSYSSHCLFSLSTNVQEFTMSCAEEPRLSSTEVIYVLVDRWQVYDNVVVGSWWQDRWGTINL